MLLSSGIGNSDIQDFNQLGGSTSLQITELFSFGIELILTLILAWAHILIHTHTLIHTLCERDPRRYKEAGRQRTNFSRRHSYGCSANASICHCLVCSVVPTSWPRVYCSYSLTYTTLGKRRGGPLSSAPFTKQPLWSEARIRMIMWTLAAVYQQVACSCSAKHRPAASERAVKKISTLSMCTGEY